MMKKMKEEDKIKNIFSPKLWKYKEKCMVVLKEVASTNNLRMWVDVV